MTMRMNRTERAYSEAKAAGTLVPLNEELSHPDDPGFEYWKIVDNRFPHDRHHDIHVMAVLKRDCDVAELTAEEVLELWQKVFAWADARYDYVKLNLSGLRSVKVTPHIHLLTLKPEYK